MTFQEHALRRAVEGLGGTVLVSWGTHVACEIVAPDGKAWANRGTPSIRMRRPRAEAPELFEDLRAEAVRGLQAALLPADDGADLLSVLG